MPRAKPTLASSTVGVMLWTTVSSAPGCAAIWSGSTYRAEANGRVCRHNSGLVAVDYALGTLAIVGTFAALAFSEVAEGFLGVAGVGAVGTMAHFVSASTTDVGSCRGAPYASDSYTRDAYAGKPAAPPREPYLPDDPDDDPDLRPHPPGPRPTPGPITLGERPWDAEPALSKMIGFRVKVVRKDGGELTHELRAVRSHRIVFVDGTEWNVEDLASVAPSPP